MATKFFTEVELPRDKRGLVRHGQQILTLGSCFADEIGFSMTNELFTVEVNPFGPLFNPVSILNTLQIMEENRQITVGDLIRNQGLWHSPDFHSSFSESDPEIMANNLNDLISDAHHTLSRLSAALITLGSTRTFIYRRIGRTVANCHKLPASDFDIKDLTVNEVTGTLEEIFTILRRNSPEVKVIITVSPVRHKAYGLHADKLSKATLLLAADTLCRSHPEAVTYFPAYEILQDQLRDYRFYADDMTHPSSSAVKYIYECFKASFFDTETEALAAGAASVVQRLLHRPLSHALAGQTRAEAIAAADAFAMRHPQVASRLQLLVSTLNPI